MYVFETDSPPFLTKTDLTTHFGLVIPSALNDNDLKQLIIFAHHGLSSFVGSKFDTNEQFINLTNFQKESIRQSIYALVTFWIVNGFFRDSASISRSVGSLSVSDSNVYKPDTLRPEVYLPLVNAGLIELQKILYTSDLITPTTISDGEQTQFDIYINTILNDKFYNKVAIDSMLEVLRTAAGTFNPEDYHDKDAINSQITFLDTKITDLESSKLNTGVQELEEADLPDGIDKLIYHITTTVNNQILYHYIPKTKFGELLNFYTKEEVDKSLEDIVAQGGGLTLDQIFTSSNNVRNLNEQPRDDWGWINQAYINNGKFTAKYSNKDQIFDWLEPKIQTLIEGTASFFNDAHYSFTPATSITAAGLISAVGFVDNKLVVNSSTRTQLLDWFLSTVVLGENLLERIFIPSNITPEDRDLPDQILTDITFKEGKMVTVYHDKDLLTGVSQDYVEEHFPTKTDVYLKKQIDALISNITAVDTVETDPELLEYDSLTNPTGLKWDAVPTESQRAKLLEVLGENEYEYSVSTSSLTKARFYNFPGIYRFYNFKDDQRFYRFYRNDGESYTEAKNRILGTNSDGSDFLTDEQNDTLSEGIDYTVNGQTGLSTPEGYSALHNLDKAQFYGLLKKYTIDSGITLANVFEPNNLTVISGEDVGTNGFPTRVEFKNDKLEVGYTSTTKIKEALGSLESGSLETKVNLESFKDWDTPYTQAQIDYLTSKESNLPAISSTTNFGDKVLFEGEVYYIIYASRSRTLFYLANKYKKKTKSYRLESQSNITLQYEGLSTPRNTHNLLSYIEDRSNHPISDATEENINSLFRVSDIYETNRVSTFPAVPLFSAGDTAVGISFDNILNANEPEVLKDNIDEELPNKTINKTSLITHWFSWEVPGTLADSEGNILNSYFLEQITVLTNKKRYTRTVKEIEPASWTILENENLTNEQILTVWDSSQNVITSNQNFDNNVSLTIKEALNQYNNILNEIAEKQDELPLTKITGDDPAAQKDNIVVPWMASRFKERHTLRRFETEKFSPDDKLLIERNDEYQSPKVVITFQDFDSSIYDGFDHIWETGEHWTHEHLNTDLPLFNLPYHEANIHFGDNFSPIPKDTNPLLTKQRTAWDFFIFYADGEQRVSGFSDGSFRRVFLSHPLFFKLKFEKELIGDYEIKMNLNINIPNNRYRSIMIIPMYREISTGKVLTIAEYHEKLNNDSTSPIPTVNKEFSANLVGVKPPHNVSTNWVNIYRSLLKWKGDNITSPIDGGIIKLPGAVHQDPYSNPGSLSMINWFSNYGGGAVSGARPLTFKFKNLGVKDSTNVVLLSGEELVPTFNGYDKVLSAFSHSHKYEIVGFYFGFGDDYNRTSSTRYMTVDEPFWPGAGSQIIITKED